MNEEEAAAAMAAVSSILDEEATIAAMQHDSIPPKRWPTATRLITQGIIPTRLPGNLNWGSIERLRRATRGGTGITGQ
ncbi:MAG: hypothetical protein EI684_19395 [Candidatus Viridilinea halotolerans]|uniref:Uncharacterized protein n=1 Tax=Candidatus Viridilinea halotolerans TaxID=2491704 RepID=A0A426TSQ3_9CHLR|nr:MAG: hypothetical protein EI684_19395 [Candidatus Viridilinea halotolerans]